MSSRASFRRGFAFGSLSFVSTALLALVASVVTARLYGLHVVGEFALISVLPNAVMFLSTTQEQPALVRALASIEPRDPEVTGLAGAVFLFSFALTMVVSVVAAGVCYLVFQGPLNRPELFLPAIVSLAIYALFANTAWNADTVLTAFRAGRPLFWVRLHQGLVFSTLR